MELGWEFYTPKPKQPAAKWEKLSHESTATHTFAKPGLYEVALTVKSGKDTDRETVHIWVTAGKPPAPVGGAIVEGNGVRIQDGDDTPSAFDHTHFGTAGEGERNARTFLLFNRGDADLSCSGKAVTLKGAHAGDFHVVRGPRKSISPLGSASFVLEFRPRGGGTRTAEVTVRAGSETIRFTVAGTAAIDQEKIDARAAGPFKAAKKLFDNRRWSRAESALAEFLERFPGAKVATEASALLERVRTDPEIRKEIDAAAQAAGAARDQKKQEARAKSLFKMAESSMKNGRKDMAEKYWKQILEKYPDTTWAEKAGQRLAK